MSRIAVMSVAALLFLGCKGEGQRNDAKREADRIMMRMEDLQASNAKLRARVEQLEKENAALRGAKPTTAAN